MTPVVTGLFMEAKLRPLISYVMEKAGLPETDAVWIIGYLGRFYGFGQFDEGDIDHYLEPDEWDDSGE